MNLAATTRCPPLRAQKNQLSQSAAVESSVRNMHCLIEFSRLKGRGRSRTASWILNYLCRNKVYVLRSAFLDCNTVDLDDDLR